MADADVIARAAIELVTDASKALNGLKDVQDSLDYLNESAKVFTDEVLQRMYDRLATLPDAEFGKTIAEQAAKGGESIKDFVERLADADVALGRNKDAAIALGDAYVQYLQNEMGDAARAAAFEIEQFGKITEQTKERIDALTEASRRASASYQKQAETARKAAKAQEEQNGLTNVANAVVSKFGLNLKSLASGLAASTIAVKAFNVAWKEVQQGIQVALEFDALQRRLEIAVRASQRAMGEQAMTIEEWNAFATDLAHTYGILESKVIGIATQAVRVGTTFKLTTEETKKLTEAAIVMGESIGGDVTRNMNLLVRYITGGRASAALEQLGFDLSTVTLNAKAQTMGLGELYKELSEAEKRTVRYALVMEQLNIYQEDVIASSETMSSRLADLKVDSEQASAALGAMFLPMKLTFEQAMLSLKQLFVLTMWGIGGTVKAFAMMFMTIGEGYERLEQAAAGKNILDAARSVADEAGKLWQEYLVGDFTAALDENGRKIDEWYVNLVGDYDGLGNAAKASGDAIADGMSEAERAASEAVESMTEDLDELTREFEEAGDRIERNYGRKLDDIFTDTIRATQDAQRELSQDLADIDEAAFEERAQASIDFQVDKERMTEDHLRRMKELETDYLFDLQDAVRERDARQVLELMRRYNMQRQEEENDYSLRQKRRKQEYELELRDIERQRIRKRQARFAEYQQELADIQIAEARKREELELWRKRQYEDLLISMQEKFAALIAEVVKEAGLTGEAFDLFIKAVGTRLGPNSPFTGMLDYARQYTINTVQGVIQGVNTAMGALAAMSKALSKSGMSKALPSSSGPYTSQGSYNRANGIGFQTGGDFIATSPQTITVGERPERVSIQPLNRATGEAAGNMGRGGGGGRGGGRVEVAVKLSEGLEGSIVDQAMAEVADVFVTIQRGERATPTGGGRR